MEARDSGARSFGAILAYLIGTPVQSVRQFARLSLRAIGPDRKMLGWLIGLSSVSAAIQTGLLFVLAMMGVALTSPQGPPSVVRSFSGPWRIDTPWLIPIAAGLTIAIIAAAYPIARLQSAIGARAVQRARIALADGYLAGSVDYRHSYADGYLQLCLVDYANYLALTVQHFVNFCIAAIALCTLVLVPFFLNIKIALVQAAILAISISLLLPLLRRVRRDSTKRSSINRDLSNYISQIARIGDDIEAFRIGDAVASRVGNRIGLGAESLRSITFQESIGPTIFQFGSLTVLIALLGIVLVAFPGQHPGVAVLALLMFRVLLYGRQMLGAFQQGSSWSHFVEQVFDEIEKSRASAKARGTRSPTRFGGLRAQGVGFVYGGGKRALEDISFAIEPGEAVGIIGPSGCGKSTLCSLMLGLRSPSAGTMKLGEDHVASIDDAGWLRLAAYVPQECRLLSGTVADNIAFFRNQYSLAEIRAAAADAHIEEEILALPAGFETIIGPGGGGLSGGQTQRLVIARALLSNPQFLIMDEPSSALDHTSEALIAQTLLALKGRTTLMIIAHRPALLAACDRILRMSGGRIVEDRAT